MDADNLRKANRHDTDDYAICKILDVRIDVRRHHPSSLNSFSDRKNYEALQSSRKTDLFSVVLPTGHFR